jgi:hypothetical protein
MYFAIFLHFDNGIVIKKSVNIYRANVASLDVVITHYTELQFAFSEYGFIIIHSSYFTRTCFVIHSAQAID